MPRQRRVAGYVRRTSCRAVLTRAGAADMMGGLGSATRFSTYHASQPSSNSGSWYQLLRVNHVGDDHGVRAGWAVGEPSRSRAKKRKALNASDRAVRRRGSRPRPVLRAAELRTSPVRPGRAPRRFEQDYAIAARTVARRYPVPELAADRQKQAVLGLVERSAARRRIAVEHRHPFDKLADTLPSSASTRRHPHHASGRDRQPAMLDYYASLTTGAPGQAGTAGALTSQRGATTRHFGARQRRRSSTDRHPARAR